MAGIWINVAVETVNERANELNGRFVATTSSELTKLVTRPRARVSALKRRATFYK